MNEKLKQVWESPSTNVFLAVIAGAMIAYGIHEGVDMLDFLIEENNHPESIFSFTEDRMFTGFEVLNIPKVRSEFSEAAMFTGLGLILAALTDRKMKSEKK